MKSQRLSSRLGFSLFEVAAASLLVGMVMIGALELLGSTIRATQITHGSRDIESLAHDLLSEVMSECYVDNNSALPVFGIEADETTSPTNRSDFDDLDDYHGWSESPPREKNGTLIAGYTGWTRSVLVTRVDALDPARGLAAGEADQGLRRIKVAVTDATGRTFNSEALRSKQGAIEQPLGLDAMLVNRLKLKVSAGTAPEVRGQTNLLNHAMEP